MRLEKTCIKSMCEKMLVTNAQGILKEPINVASSVKNFSIKTLIRPLPLIFSKAYNR
jgi:hypothetical protein